MISNIAMVATDETKWIAFGTCRIISVFGWNNNTTGAGDDRWLQFHEKPDAAIAASDVPAVKSLYFPGGTSANYGTNAFGNGGLTLAELSAAISSTEAAYTAVTNTGLDLTIVVDSEFLVKSGTTLVGDLTTGVNTRQVWSEANGASTPKILRAMTIKNTGGSSLNAFVGAEDSTAPADSTMIGPFLITAGATKSYFFGIGGHHPYKKDGNGTVHQGCTIYYSNDLAKPFTFPASTDMAARAIYE